MRIAVISDIHGNAIALEAVLADIRTRKVDQTINLGDLVSGPLWPSETMEILSHHNMPTVRGNHDRSVSGPDRDRMAASDRFAYDALDHAHRQWLGKLATTIDAGDGILAFHGTPSSDMAYLVEEIHDRRLIRSRPDAIRQRLGDVQARVVLCGHSHLPHLMQLPDGPLIINPGSAGLPAGAGDRYVSEAGSPHARYAVLTVSNDRVETDLIAVTYKWEIAAERAEENGRPEWAHALRTGFMPSGAG